MNKICKLSLAAAVALGSLSALSADFIDSSSINGYTRVDFSNSASGDDKSADVTKTSMRFELNMKTEIAEGAHSFVRLRVDSSDSRDASADEKGSVSNGTLTLKRAYVDFKVPGVDIVSARVGRSYDSTYDTDLNMLRATASTDLGSFSAGFTNQVAGDPKGGSRMFLDGSLSDVVPGMSADFHYGSYNPSKNLNQKSNMYVKGAFDVSGVSLAAVYLSETPETGDAGSAMGAQASADMGGISLTGTYMQTDKKGGAANAGLWGTYNLYSGDVVGDITGIAWGGLSQLNAVTLADASSISAAASADMSGISLTGTFASNKWGEKKNTEFGGVASVSVSKGLALKAMYGTATEDEDNGLDAASAWKLRAQLSF